MAVFNEPTKWAQTLGKDADVTTIPDTAGDTDPSIDKIFPSVFSIPLAQGGKAIPRSVLNGLFKLLGDWVYYIQNGGLPTYSENFDYVAGRVVSYNDNIYKCIQANGVSSTVVTPNSGTEYWQRLDNFVRSVNGVNADASGNVTLDISSGVTVIEQQTTTATIGYRLWSNGFLEQWGVVYSSSEHASETITMLKPFEDYNYTLVTGITTTSKTNIYDPNAFNLSVAIIAKTTTSFTIISTPSDGGVQNWYACGQGA